jgi:hypothetical protein
LRADAIRPPPGHRHRHNYRLLLRPCGKASEARKTSSTPTATCNQKLQMATCQGTTVIRGSGAVPFSCDSGGKIIPPRTALRTWRKVGRPRPPHPAAQSRSTVVDTSTRPRQRQEHTPASRVSVHPLRQFGIWLGAVLNGILEARGFWGIEDEGHHITWKELKAVRLAVLSFLPHLAAATSSSTKTTTRSATSWPA